MSSTVPLRKSRAFPSASVAFCPTMGLRKLTGRSIYVVAYVLKLVLSERRFELQLWYEMEGAEGTSRLSSLFIPRAMHVDMHVWHGMAIFFLRFLLSGYRTVRYSTLQYES